MTRRTTSSSNLYGDKSVRASAPHRPCAPACLDIRHGFRSRGDCDERADKTSDYCHCRDANSVSSQLDLPCSGCGDPDQVFDTRHEGHSSDREHEIYVLLHTGWIFFSISQVTRHTLTFSTHWHRCASHAFLMRAVRIWSCCVQGADRSARRYCHCHGASRTAHFEVNLLAQRTWKP